MLEGSRKVRCLLLYIESRASAQMTGGTILWVCLKVSEISRTKLLSKWSKSIILFEFCIQLLTDTYKIFIIIRHLYCADFLSADYDSALFTIIKVYFFLLIREFENVLLRKRQCIQSLYIAKLEIKYVRILYNCCTNFHNRNRFLYSHTGKGDNPSNSQLKWRTGDI